MERSEPEVRVGKMCAMRADGGRCGRSRVAVCVE